MRFHKVVIWDISRGCRHVCSQALWCIPRSRVGDIDGRWRMCSRMSKRDKQFYYKFNDCVLVMWSEIEQWNNEDNSSCRVAAEPEGSALLFCAWIKLQKIGIELTMKNPIYPKNKTCSCTFLRIRWNYYLWCWMKYVFSNTVYSNIISFI